MLSRHHVFLFTWGVLALCSFLFNVPSRLFSYLPQEGAGREEPMKPVVMEITRVFSAVRFPDTVVPQRSLLPRAHSGCARPLAGEDTHADRRTRRKMSTIISSALRISHTTADLTAAQALEGCGWAHGILRTGLSQGVWPVCPTSTGGEGGVGTDRVTHAHRRPALSGEQAERGPAETSLDPGPCECEFAFSGK